MTDSSPGELLRDRRVARPDALAEVREARDEHGARVLQLRLDEGWHLDVLPDRGLDVGAAWWGGRPVGWRSPIAADPGAGSEWSERFLGGLVTTCGTDNIGPARAGFGMHGSHSLTPAVEVAWRREPCETGLRIRITGRIESRALYGRRIVVERELSLATGDPTLTLRDTLRNEGAETEPLALLYHVNIGAPYVVPGTRIQTDAVRLRTRDDEAPVEWARVVPVTGPPSASAVVEHLGLATPSALITSPGGREVRVSWSGDSLPRLFQWVWPEPGAGVVAIEPATAPLFGSERDAPHAGAPLLDPGAELEVELRIAVREPGTAAPAIR